MQANRYRDTSLELSVRRLVHSRGLRYRVDIRPEAEIRRRADLVFRRARVAVFLDGCFWHGCELHYRSPSQNAEFWDGKIRHNRERDVETTRLLEERGWAVLRFWEHEKAESIAACIESAIRQL